MHHTDETELYAQHPLPSQLEALRAENARLESDLRAFVALALQNGMRSYCEARHPELTSEIDSGIKRARSQAERKYDRVLEALRHVPDLHATQGETGERTYYRNTEDDVAYLEHGLVNRRFMLSGIWVAPAYRGRGIAHAILRRLVEAADEVGLGIELRHDPFGDQGLDRAALEAFYNRHGFQRHEATPGGLFRFPRTPLDQHARPSGTSH
ncbi:MAG: N-acetyltransferase [Rhodobacteraceae bacterium]|jgi:GNAT superfamily N-acetyltransferase|uniref:Acetyltransferase (GNAT) domain-containing protein n=1 Tax=Salipiger profundus TaxID=1229727 RepID=A0A1U7D7G9_9RHOB|nr:MULTISPECIES: GNAT family N-acetyltransferase [Salipiger]APX24117.1 Acetyltransferase (GNAT) domain-containing protein [Salipiger profundus]MAB06906.1 N-acetyltransferase [Paracoccaceae bacterium]GFZ94738.1 hypothetical protein GCM10011326_01950 [Salipiger profundus]SFB90605.1 Acetyltransferase (GNAT) domain-containing protein [Salipiger profundus]